MLTYSQDVKQDRFGFTLLRKPNVSMTWGVNRMTVILDDEHGTHVFVEYDPDFLRVRSTQRAPGGVNDPGGFRDYRNENGSTWRDALTSTFRDLLDDCLR